MTNLLRPDRPGGLTLLALVAAAMLSLSACGGGGGSVIATGTIEIVNSSFSFEAITSVRVVEEFGPDDIFVQTFIRPGENFFIDGLVPGSYTVILNWTDGSRDTFGGVDVFSRTTTTVFAEN